MNFLHRNKNMLYTGTMYMLENVPLSAYSTMRLGGNASYLTDITSRQEVAEAVAWADERRLPMVMIGSGSNIVWADSGFPGLVMVNKIQNFEVQETGDIERYVTGGAGMNWDEFVARTVELGLTGIEFLSLVPGTVGATPVQNVGAYGQEVSNTIVTIEAYDRITHQYVTIRNGDCNFAYRSSKFKTTEKGRYILTGVTFFLTKGNPNPPFYASVEQYCKDHGVTTITPQVGRDAVIAIRQAKLPDPAVVANNGSFFANPIVDAAKFLELHADYAEISHWPTDGGRVKLSAAWLIEQAGLKDVHDAETGMATWPNQPLVLVNEKAQSTADLLAFKQKVVDAVQTKFGVTLEQEPEYIELAADNNNTTNA